jgi:hypothetical protein
MPTPILASFGSPLNVSSSIYLLGTDAGKMAHDKAEGVFRVLFRYYENKIKISCDALDLPQDIRFHVKMWEGIFEQQQGHCYRHRNGYTSPSRLDFKLVAMRQTMRSFLVNNDMNQILLKVPHLCLLTMKQG